MNKFLTAGLLALGLLAGAQQRAAAWVNCKFCIGIGWCWQSGDNCCLGGLFNCGPYPGCGGPYPAVGYTPYPPFAPAPCAYPYGYGCCYGPGCLTPMTPPTPMTPMQGPPRDPFFFLQWD